MILKLEKSLRFDSFVKPACLPGTNFKPALNSKCFVSGWGATETPPAIISQTEARRRYEEDLRWADVYITGEGGCQNISNEMICANNFKGKDTCQGDSGGPLICLENGIPVLTGVTSFGLAGCGGIGVYTRVTSYLPWIKSQMVCAR